VPPPSTLLWSTTCRYARKAQGANNDGPITPEVWTQTSAIRQLCQFEGRPIIGGTSTYDSIHHVIAYTMAAPELINGKARYVVDLGRNVLCLPFPLGCDLKQQKLGVATVNVDTCDFVHTHETLDNGHQVSALAFDVATEKVFGLGIMPVESLADAQYNATASTTKTWVRTLVTFDAVDHVFSLIGVVQDYLLMSGVEASLDPLDRSMYVVAAL